jgi:multidrug transporter EmrE-like cation transporter
MQLLLVATATALLYAVGGMFMKLSNGYTSLLPSVLSYILFALGVHLQIYLLTHNSSLGATGILVLGLDTLCTVLLGVFLFKEAYTSIKMAGLALVVMGAIFLQAEGWWTA